MSYSRVKRRALKKQKSKQVSLGLLVTSFTVGLTSQSVNTDSYFTSSNEEKIFENFGISTLETSVSLTVEATKAVSTEANSVALETTNLIKSVNYEQTFTVASQPTGNDNFSLLNYESVVNVPQGGVTSNYPGTLSNGNTAGVIGTEAAAKMAAATGVPQSTWEYIIARESNGNPNVANASGASGLFQTMPGWGSTATVQDQINSALNAYKSQGLSAWGM